VNIFYRVQRSSLVSRGVKSVVQKSFITTALGAINLKKKQKNVNDRSCGAKPFCPLGISPNNI